MTSVNELCVFVGASRAGENIVKADTHEIYELAELSLAAGAFVGDTTAAVWEHILAVKPDVVVIEGSYARACVADTVKWALQQGVGRVVVDLHNIRLDGDDVGSNPDNDVLVMRDEYLTRGLRDYVNDPRISVVK